MAEIHIITGPPAAGKSTYVTEHKQPGDIIIDYDAIANTLAGVDPANHSHPAHVKAVTKAARQAAIDTAIKQDCTVWIIHSSPSQSIMNKYKQLGANIHTVDPGKSIVMKRCKHERPPEMLKIAAQWYDKHTKGKTSRHQRGYGTPHDHARRRLMVKHKDGTPCWWCGKPMYRDKNRNFDGLPLCADHEDANGARDGKPATRLLHFTCNSSRKDGRNDHNRPALKKTPVQPANFVW